MKRNIFFLISLWINIALSKQKVYKQKHGCDDFCLANKAHKHVERSKPYFIKKNTSLFGYFDPFDNHSLDNKPTYEKFQGFMYNQALSAIASIVFPPIQPVLEIISAASSSIYTQIIEIFNTALSGVQDAINESSSNVQPLIIAAITTSNTSLANQIKSAFVQALTNITLDINSLTTAVNTGTTNMMNTNVGLLLQSISNRLITADGAVDAAVEAGVAENLSLIITAVTLANNNVYTQLVNALNSPTNTSAIFPTLVYADPVAIARILSSGNNALYTNIANLINGALSDINQYVILANTSETNAQTILLNDTLTAIKASIDTNINNHLLPNVQQSITTVTSTEVAALEAIINTNNGNLTSAVHDIVSGLNIQVETIVNNVTTQEITDMINLITTDLAGITSQVTEILAVE